MQDRLPRSLQSEMLRRLVAFKEVDLPPATAARTTARRIAPKFPDAWWTAFGDPQIIYDDISNRWIVENFTGALVATPLPSAVA